MHRTHAHAHTHVTLEFARRMLACIGIVAAMAICQLPVLSISISVYLTLFFEKNYQCKHGADGTHTHTYM